MGVSRNIKIVVFTTIESSFELLKKFLVGFWIESTYSYVNTFYLDETNNDILPKERSLESLEIIFNKRDLKKKQNLISFSVDSLSEGLILRINRLENNLNDKRKYEISISPSGAHKLKDCERNTDFSFYLNIILPRLKEIGCYSNEIVCKDIE